MPDATKRLLLLDGHSLAYRAFFALPVENFSTTTGQHTNAVFGFTSMLINVLRDEQPTHIGVAFDKSRNTFRLQEYAEYKAKRNKTPDEFSSQLPLIDEVLDALKIRHLRKEGFEADDIIATLVTQALADDFEVLILSGDRDAFQLVTERSTVLYPMRGVSELARMTPDAVQARYGVPPARYPDLAAIVGETSDNLPGVPGVGPGFAARWLNEYDGLDNVITHADKITGKKGEALREHLGDVIRNRHLNELVRDLDLELAPDDLEAQSWDRQLVHTLFDSLEFRVLRERLLESWDVQHEQIDESGFELAGSRLAPGEVERLAHRAHRRGPHRRDRPRSLGLGHRRGLVAWRFAAADGTGAWVDAGEVSPEDDAAIMTWFDDPAPRQGAARRQGPDARAGGARVAAAGAGQRHRPGGVPRPARPALLRPGRPDAALPQARAQAGRRPMTGQLTFDALDDSVSSDATDTAMLHARAVVDLADALDDEIEERGGSRLLAEVELPLIDLLALMEQTGIAVDIDHLQSLEAEFAGGVKLAAEAAYSAIGKEINLGSPKQLQVVLFDELGMPKTKRTKTGYTTDADALVGLLAKVEEDTQAGQFLLHLLRHRDVARLRQTIEGLLKTVADDGRIHTTFNQLIAATGRLSSTEPNLQNIPIRTEEGRRIREGFIVRRRLRVR